MSSLTEQVDALFGAWDRADSPGCALGVVQDGVLVYARGYGMANLEYGVPIAPSSVFHVASISKQFTAFAVALLAREGRLSLDEDVRAYLPEVPDFGHPITCRHLIHHTSGLRDQWDLLFLAGWREDDVKTNGDVLDLVTRQRALNFEPGQEYVYCNTGYTLLGLIVERVTGVSLRSFTADRLFGPLGMAATHFHDDHRMIVKNRASAYEPRDEGGLAISIPAFDTVGATSLFTTVEDLAIWARSLQDGSLAGREFIAQMLTPGTLAGGERLDYAFGLALGKHRGLPTVGHGGADAGYRADFVLFPDQHLAVVVLANLSTFEPWRLARQVAEIYLDGAFPPQEQAAPAAAPAEPVPLPSAEELALLAGLYRAPRSGIVRRLSLRDGALTVEVGPGFALLPLARDRFTMAGLPVEVAFVTAGDGVRELHETLGDGKTTIYRAVPAATPSPAELAAYSGTYDSAELGTAYTFRADGGNLIWQRRKFADSVLAPTTHDEFTADGWVQFSFTRDERRHVAVLEVTTERVRRLQFTRRPPAGDAGAA